MSARQDLTRSRNRNAFFPDEITLYIFNVSVAYNLDSSSTYTRLLDKSLYAFDMWESQTDFSSRGNYQIFEAKTCVTGNLVYATRHVLAFVYAAAAAFKVSCCDQVLRFKFCRADGRPVILINYSSLVCVVQKRLKIMLGAALTRGCIVAHRRIEFTPENRINKGAAAV